MTKVVVGRYRSIAEAESKVTELLNDGFPARSISAEGKRSQVSSLKGLGILTDHENGKNAEDNSVWNLLKGFFGDDELEKRKGENAYTPDEITVSVNDTLAPNYLMDKLRSRSEQLV